MGTEISDIVDVTITRETARVLQAGFGVPLILGTSFRIPDRVKTYSEPEDLLSDGFATTDEIHKAAVSMFAQELSPENFKVGRKLENVNSLQKITFNALATAGTFTVTVEANTTAGIAWNATASTIKTAIEALANVTEVTIVGDMPVLILTVEFTGVDGNRHWDAISVNVSALTGVDSATITQTQFGSAEDASYTVALNAVLAADPNWYALMSTTRVKSEIKELALIIQIKKKIYSAASDDADVLTNVSDDIASELKALGHTRTSYMWSADEESYPEAAWLGGNLPKNPGSLTWKFKKLIGIIPDTLSGSDLGFLKSKNANFFESVADNAIVTGEGVMASGEFIDIIRGIDFLDARIGEDVFAIFLNNDKVPYTNKGVSLLVSPLRARLLDAASPAVALITKESIIINEPDVSNALAADKANRLLKEITFSATLQGAVHKLEIKGKLSL